MARKRYHKRRYRKKSWVKKFIQSTHDGMTVSAGSQFSKFFDIVQAPVDNSQVVPQPYYVTRIKVQFEIEEATPGDSAAVHFEGLVGYICYVPEDITPTPLLPEKHPEWVLGHRFYGSLMSDITQTKVFTCYSPLKKKLNSGDKIVFLVTGYNTSQNSSYSFYINNFISFYSR